MPKIIGNTKDNGTIVEFSKKEIENIAQYVASSTKDDESILMALKNAIESSRHFAELRRNIKVNIDRLNALYDIIKKDEKRAEKCS